MSRQPRSIESHIAEHTKSRRQCRIRILPSLQVVGIAALLAAALLWWQVSAWKLALVIVLFPAFWTVVECLMYVRHDRALKRLLSEQSRLADGPGSP